MKTRLLTFLLISILFIACDDFNECFDQSILEKYLAFSLVDTLGNSLIGDYGTRYETDKVEMVDFFGNTPNSYEITPFGDIGFQLPIKDNNDNKILKDTLLEAIYYLKLPPSLPDFPNWDLDTLNFQYYIIESGCPDYEFSFLSIKMNDSIRYSGNYTSFLSLTKK